MIENRKVEKKVKVTLSLTIREMLDFCINWEGVDQHLESGAINPHWETTNRISQIFQRAMKRNGAEFRY